MTKGKVLSFKNAFEGIWVALKEQDNLKFHLILAGLAISLGTIFNITQTEWLLLTLTIGLVICLELTNTAIEEVVNSFTDKIHPSAKKAKDVAAGAVLVGALTATIVGTIIFLPYFLNLLFFFV